MSNLEDREANLIRMLDELGEVQRKVAELKILIRDERNMIAWLKENGGKNARLSVIHMGKEVDRLISEAHPRKGVIPEEDLKKFGLAVSAMDKADRARIAGYINGKLHDSIVDHNLERARAANSLRGAVNDVR